MNGNGGVGEQRGYLDMMEADWGDAIEEDGYEVFDPELDDEGRGSDPGSGEPKAASCPLAAPAIQSAEGAAVIGSDQPVGKGGRPDQRRRPWRSNDMGGMPVQWQSAAVTWTSRPQALLDAVLGSLDQPNSKVWQTQLQRARDVPDHRGHVQDVRKGTWTAWHFAGHRDSTDWRANALRGSFHRSGSAHASSLAAGRTLRCAREGHPSVLWPQAPERRPALSPRGALRVCKLQINTLKLEGRGRISFHQSIGRPTSGNSVTPSTRAATTATWEPSRQFREATSSTRSSSPCSGSSGMWSRSTVSVTTSGVLPWRWCATKAVTVRWQSCSSSSIASKQWASGQVVHVSQLIPGWWDGTREAL